MHPKRTVSDIIAKLTAQNSHKLFMFFLGIVLLGVITIVDIITGPEIAFSIFYLVPILLWSWFLGNPWAYSAALLSAILWLVSDFLAGHRYHHPFIPYWNAGVRMGFFFIVPYFFLRLQDELKRQQADNLRLTQVNEEILRLSRIKSEFVAMVSHELRTPLTAIKESIHIVYDGAAGAVNEEQKTYLEMSKRNIDRLRRLIDDILDFSKLEAGKVEFKMSENDVNALIADIMKFHIPVAVQKKLTLRTELATNLPRVLLDADRIFQVLNNLISNAIKFTEKGEIVIGTKRREDHIEVYVKDTGIGIAPNDLSKLFVPFEQVRAWGKDKLGGTGLGLAISRQIIEKHNGKISVKSKVGHGTEICFFLPVTDSGDRRDGF
ncbi:MAG: HAMP domain-containing histidine kinase [Candidatus Omnitrophica bacterium]|nr:HAMP domain-containing histidine kinase [Candidatus Omnitrophota bacterium]